MGKRLPMAKTRSMVARATLPQLIRLLWFILPASPPARSVGDVPAHEPDLQDGDGPRQEQQDDALRGRVAEVEELERGHVNVVDQGVGPVGGAAPGEELDHDKGLEGPEIGRASCRESV